jgi:protein-S-isoprenylcysteine O-methyltransferase Ste14
MTVPPQTRDLLGRASLCLYFTFCATVKGISVFHLAITSNWPPSVVFSLSAEVASLGFLILVVATTLVRLPPIRSAKGIQPRLVALAGAFLTVTLVALPPVQVGATVRLLSDALVLGGFALCIWCLWWLGRSFSVMAQARRLITTGPYGFVRHPLYACEAVALAGIVMSKPSWAALSIAIVALAFQYLRIRNEEAVLREAFPEFQAYSESVPMLLPLSRRSRHDQAAARAGAPVLDRSS